MNTSKQLNEKKKQLQIIVIDNYDSFTYNLVNQFKLIGAKVIVFRNDVPIEDIFSLQRLNNMNTVIVISPGPGNPSSAGNSLEIIEKYTGILPILGICLGHQAIVQHYGGEIGRATQIVHGKADDIFFEKNDVFSEMESPLRAARYHSLVATRLPQDLAVLARTKDEVMAVIHTQDKTLGFQFHPESILTTKGTQLLRSAIDWLLDSNDEQKLNTIPTY